MKVTIDIDCTPEEARTFLGLPDVKPMQEQMMHELQEQMTATVRSLTPEEMMKTWLPVSVAGLEQMQQLFARMATGKG